MTATLIGPGGATASELDYVSRTDGNPVYVGKAPPGTLTSTALWTIQRLTYDATSRLIRVQVKTAVAWDDRATLDWS